MYAAYTFSEIKFRLKGLIFSIIGLLLPIRLHKNPFRQSRHALLQSTWLKDAKYVTQFLDNYWLYRPNSVFLGIFRIKCQFSVLP